MNGKCYKFPWLCMLTDCTNVWYLYKRIYVLINTHISVIYLNIKSSGAHSKEREIVEEGLKRSLNASHQRIFFSFFLIHIFCERGLWFITPIRLRNVWVLI